MALASRVLQTFETFSTQYGDDVLDKAEDEQQKVESLTWCDEPNGMVRFTADLSPDHAELFKQAIQSLAGPSPKSECCDDPHHRHTADANGNSRKTGEPDPRTAGKRRADALLLLLGLGAEAVDSDGQIKHRGSENSALLCSTHHRIVHRDNLTATVADTPASPGTTPRPRPQPDLGSAR